MMKTSDDCGMEAVIEWTIDRRGWSFRWAVILKDKSDRVIKTNLG